MKKYLTIPVHIDIIFFACGSVGIGRRARLRILWWLHRVGSSPIFRIFKGSSIWMDLFCIKGEYEFELDCFKVSDSFFVSICLDKYSVCNLNASTNISPEKRNLAESMVRNRAIIVYETPEKKNLAEFVVKNRATVVYETPEKKKFKKVVDFLESPLYTNKRAKEHEAHKKCRSGGIGRRAGFRCLWSLRPCGFKSHLLHLFLFYRDYLFAG